MAGEHQGLRYYKGGCVPQWGTASLSGAFWEKHLRTIVSRLSIEEISRDLEGHASKVHAASSIDLAKMGLELISFTIEDISPA